MVGCGHPAAAPKEPTVRHESPPLFDFHVDFWVNLHQRLYAETSPRAPAGEGDLADEWRSALDVYRRELPERGMNRVFDDPRLVDLNRRLSAAGDAPTLSGAGIEPRLGAALEAAAGVYRAGSWVRDATGDRAWIASIAPLLAAHGEAIATELEHVYGAAWQRPVRVDVSSFAGPVGAYTVLHPTHVTITSSDPRYQGTAALEMLFHEASHDLVEGIQARLDAAISAARKPPEPTLWHALLFFTAGEIVRRRVDPGYLSYADAKGLYDRAPQWRRYRDALSTAWVPYLDRRVTLEEALRRLAELV
jgi:hypothetical protein